MSNQIKARIEEKLYNQILECLEGKSLSEFMREALEEKVNKINNLKGNKLMSKLREVKAKYDDVRNELNLEKANGSLSTLVNLRSKVDESFDCFFDRKELRVKYEGAWDFEEDVADFSFSVIDLEAKLDKEDLEDLIELYERRISETEEELADLKEDRIRQKEEFENM